MQQPLSSALNKSFTKATATPLVFSVKSGDLKLRLNNRKNIFYANDVTALEVLPNYEALIGIKRIGIDDGSYATQGKQLNALAVDIEPKDTIIGGSYKDTMPVKNLMPYQVKIYITYEVEV